MKFTFDNGDTKSVKVRLGTEYNAITRKDDEVVQFAIGEWSLVTLYSDGTIKREGYFDQESTPYLQITKSSKVKQRKSDD